MSFEKFTKTGRGYTPKASIWMRGQIGFNQGAVEKLGIKKRKYAVLYYDKEDKRIGFQFTDDAESGATKIIKGKTGAFISAKAFLDYYDIEHSETRKYDISDDKEAGLYVIDLKE